MPHYISDYGDTEGPLGFSMKDADAKALEALLDTLPEVEYRREAVHKATTDLAPGERADVSWISTETLDRQRDVVLAAGLDDSHFKMNPIVTLAHDYSKAPVGKSPWRRKDLEADRLSNRQTFGGSSLAASSSEVDPKHNDSQDRSHVHSFSTRLSASVKLPQTMMIRSTKAQI